MNSRDDHQQVPGVTHQEEAERGLQEAPYSVVGLVDDVGTARVLIQDLEEHGVPPVSIGLLGTEEKDPGRPGRASELAESGTLGQVAKSAITGAVIGALVGGLIGVLSTLVLEDVSLLVAAGLLAIFGAGVGGAAGGMSVVKYSSPAWRESQDTVEHGRVAVAVHHSRLNVIEAAEEVMARHPTHRVSRHEPGKQPDQPG